MSAATANIGRMAQPGGFPDPAAVPDHGRVVWLRNGWRIDFSPALRGSDRYLWALSGDPFESENEAERIRKLICRDATHIALKDAIARFKSPRSRIHKATYVFDRFLEAAPSIQSERTGKFLASRTLAAYAAVLRRARPFFEGMTIAEATELKTLKRFKAWFRLSKPQGRGLQSDQEARNAFAALRAVVSWYRIERPDFPAPAWPSMPSALTAKRQSRAKRNTNKLTLGQVVSAIEQIPESRRLIFWLMFYCGARPTEARGVKRCDWTRPVLRICRSAATKHAGCPVKDFPKTDETGSYVLPEWICDMIDAAMRSADVIDPEWPLCTNPHPSARPGVIGQDALDDSWKRGCEAAGVPFVPLYRATKHTPFSALRAAGIPLDELEDLYRWSESSTAEHYDESKDERRSGVVAQLDVMVGKVRGK